MAAAALKRLRYSNEIIRQVVLLVKKHMFSENAGEKGVRRLISRVGEELIFDLIELRRADTLAQGMGQTTDGVEEYKRRVEYELAKNRAFGLKDLAINGDDLKEHFQVSEGPLVGKVLNHLLEKVLDEPDLNKREKLLALSGDFLGKRPLDI